MNDFPPDRTPANDHVAPAWLRRPLATHTLTAALAASLAIVVTLGITGSDPDGRSSGDSTTPPAASPSQTAEEVTAPPGWTLAWSDEFDGPAGARADPENWTYETGGSGWGNEELQYYTDSAENASLDGNGNLAITVRRAEPDTDLSCWYGPCQFTSARLITAGKQDFQHGRIETRVQLPSGGGLWPAVWALGESIGEVGWPQSGEIDVMEFVGNRPTAIFGTIHGPGYAGGDAFGDAYDFGRPISGEWHEFAVEWSPGSIVWEVDGVVYHSADPSDVAPDEWVFDQRFSLLANMAVGGNFGGAVNAAAEFPQAMRLDYVRVYRAD